MYCVTSATTQTSAAFRNTNIEIWFHDSHAASEIPRNSQAGYLAAFCLETFLFTADSCLSVTLLVRKCWKRFPSCFATVCDKRSLSVSPADCFDESRSSRRKSWVYISRNFTQLWWGCLRAKSKTFRLVALKWNKKSEAGLHAQSVSCESLLCVKAIECSMEMYDSATFIENVITECKYIAWGLISSSKY